LDLNLKLLGLYSIFKIKKFKILQISTNKQTAGKSAEKNISKIAGKSAAIPCGIS